jgi:tryptophan-rich sensory protein
METKQRSLIALQFLNVVAFVAVIVMNALSNALPLNGRTAGEISDMLPSYFTPAGYTFSIWGVIYLALLGFIVYQALPRQRERRLLQRIGFLFVLSSVANIAWLFAWHYGFYLLSILFMVCPAAQPHCHLPAAAHRPAGSGPHPGRAPLRAPSV